MLFIGFQLSRTFSLDFHLINIPLGKKRVFLFLGKVYTFLNEASWYERCVTTISANYSLSTTSLQLTLNPNREKEILIIWLCVFVCFCQEKKLKSKYETFM